MTSARSGGHGPNSVPAPKPPTDTVIREVPRPRTRPTTEVTIVVQIAADHARALEATEWLLDAMWTVANHPAATLTVDGRASTPATAAEIASRQLVRIQRPEAVLRILVGSRRVLCRGNPVELTRLEFDLLLFLCRHPDTVHQRSTLMAEIWGAREYTPTRTVDVHVRRIRYKLGLDFPLITTVRGVGYRVDGTNRVSIEDTYP